MASELLRKAQELLALQDVYVREAHAFSAPDFDPTLQLVTLNVQFRLQPAAHIEHCELSNEQESVRVVRYLIDAGTRILKPDVQPSDSITREQLLAEISAVFVVKYSLVNASEQLSEEMLSEFSDNAIHHMWPYWREFLQATTARLRLPAIVLPMRKGTAAASSARDGKHTSRLAKPEK